jgi:spore maturation protein CgeB
VEAGAPVRVLVCRPGPHFSVADVAQGWVKGLRNAGASVLDFNFDDRLNFYASAHVPKDGELKKAFDPAQAAMLAAKGLENAAYEYLPDVVLIVSGFFIPPAIYELLRLRGCKVVLLHTESPYEDDRQIVRAQYADLNILNDPTNLDRFREVAPTVYLPHSFDPTIHYPRPATSWARSDFCFVGTGYPSRVEFLEQVDWSGIDAAFAGNWRDLRDDSPLRPLLAHDPAACMPNEGTAEMYASTKASANLYRTEASHDADGWSMGPREVELAAIGTFFLRDPRGESDEVLPMLPTFESPDDFGEKLRWWLAHDSERDEAALKAQAAVQDRTFDQTAARLLSLL